MDIEAIRKYCLQFPHTTEIVQWGANLCLKVAGKLFVVAALEMVPQRISFKSTPENFAELCERPGIIPAPYMARAQWVSLERLNALSDSELREMIAESYRLVWERLPQKRRLELEAGVATRRPTIGKPKRASRKSAAKAKSSVKKKSAKARMRWIASLRQTVVLATVSSFMLVTNATCAEAQSASASGAAKTPHASVSPQTAALERDFFAAIRQGDAKKFLSYVPEDGLHLGPQATPTSRAEIEEQLSHHRGLYCKLFDSSCIDAPIKLDASARTCSDRELLTRSQKVRTAASETVRNSVRQAILVAEVKNEQCGGASLIDVIFNYVDGEWKLFSIP